MENKSTEQEEFQKCKDSPVYFYNKYVKKEGQKELTEAEYNDFIKPKRHRTNIRNWYSNISSSIFDLGVFSTPPTL